MCAFALEVCAFASVRMSAFCKSQGPAQSHIQQTAGLPGALRAHHKASALDRYLQDPLSQSWNQEHHFKETRLQNNYTQKKKTKTLIKKKIKLPSSAREKIKNIFFQISCSVRILMQPKAWVRVTPWGQFASVLRPLRVSTSTLCSLCFVSCQSESKPTEFLPQENT